MNNSNSRIDPVPGSEVVYDCICVLQLYLSVCVEAKETASQPPIIHPTVKRHLGKSPAEGMLCHQAVEASPLSGIQDREGEQRTEQNQGDKETGIKVRSGTR